ncbi:Hypothetical protein DHA2_150965 [Giardia duodenalis]|uniref:Uncharacterized protein n=1 Tax=Giardia intestinalis TaxID=5741 RepID=V6TAF4_GIAIN|nr:Hypothetical protein DHA2_150965 [Giardia intestinalis]
MAIAINPDVRELDFSDNVKVSKFMQDFSDFRMKKWITYRPVNAPSEAAPFQGGTRQFIINMGTGHILDTLYSGLWYTLYFVNGTDKIDWPLQASLPRTSAAWIESVTFQHSNVAAHIDERLCDYDSVATAFTSAKDILSMKHTFFTAEGQRFEDGNMFNNIRADDPYGKLLKAGASDTGRISYTTRSFFIPLCRLSSIFNSGKYFFPSLLRGNGEMTLSIRSVSQSLCEVFGGENSAMAVYSGLYPGDKIWASTNDDPLSWAVYMTNMKLVTLNLDNAFLTKEYNAFIASGRKFIRSFKGYNYQFYQVRSGYNRIEIANTHQSISHVVLAFQAPYSVRQNGHPTSALDDQTLGVQRTAIANAIEMTQRLASNVYAFTPATVTTEGNVRTDYQPAPPERVVSANDETSTNIALRAEAVSVTGRLASAVLGWASNHWDVVAGLANQAAHGAVNMLPQGYQGFAKAAIGITGHVLQNFFGNNSHPQMRALTGTVERSIDDAILKEFIYERHLPPGTNITVKLLDEVERVYGKIAPHVVAAGINLDVNQLKQAIVNSWTAMATRRTEAQRLARHRYHLMMNANYLTCSEAATIAYLVSETNHAQMPEAIKNYLKSTPLHQWQQDVINELLNRRPPAEGAGGQPAGGAAAGTGQERARARGEEVISLFALARGVHGEVKAEQIIDNALPHHLVEDNDEAELPFTAEQRTALIEILGTLLDDDALAWHKYFTQMVPCEAKQLFDMGINAIEKLQVYRGTGNGETVFSEPVNENMFYHISREAMGDSAENHPYLNYASFRKDMAVIVISLNTFMRDAHHEFWDGFSTNRVADRLYVEFESTPVELHRAANILPWYQNIAYNDNCDKLNCKVFTIYDNIYYIDRNNNLNVSDTLLPLQEGRGPTTD